MGGMQAQRKASSLIDVTRACKLCIELDFECPQFTSAINRVPQCGQIHFQLQGRMKEQSYISGV